MAAGVVPQSSVQLQSDGPRLNDVRQPLWERSVALHRPAGSQRILSVPAGAAELESVLKKPKQDLSTDTRGMFPGVRGCQDGRASPG